ncbi:MAG: hypothetical protein J7M27_04470, partial [Candidatus Latescibacteria bacterium]|nr:hypothetical protein [Candidatus Latescibacterota bacterium]
MDEDEKDGASPIVSATASKKKLKSLNSKWETKKREEGNNPSPPSPPAANLRLGALTTAAHPAPRKIPR